jgi:transcription initiation factor TFIIB
MLRPSEDGFLTCSNEACGVVQMDMIDFTAEWRVFSEDAFASNPVRCGMPINPLLPESSIGCKIICGGTMTYSMRKIARYTEWHSMPYREKIRNAEFQRIILLAHAAGIPKMIVDEACKLYNTISQYQQKQKCSFRGLHRDGIIAASIYLAFRIEQFPRTPKEIARIFFLDNASATRGCKNAMTILNEIENSTPMNQTVYTETMPSSFIARYCSHLNMNTQYTRLASFIAKQIESKNLIPENTPQSVAAGIMYFIVREFDLTISEKSIESVSDTSGVTINKCYRKMELIKHKLIPPKVYEMMKSS